MSKPTVTFDGESLITRDAIAFEVTPANAPQSDQLALASSELALILSTALTWFETGKDPVETMRWTVQMLHSLRRRLDPAVWRALIDLAQEHRVAEYFHQDPFTRWSFEKPRGYSGDARLLDFIYQHEAVQDEVANASPIGQTLYAFSKYYPSCEAVRERRDLLAKAVDAVVASRGGNAEILTIAAGHLREAALSEALPLGKISRWVALDQDPQSVGAMIRDSIDNRIEPIDGSVRGLMGNKHQLGTFDFVYSAGLYDYLPDSVAVRLTKRCLNLLKPGGVLLFANFSPEVTDDGYMETFMDWTLLLRSEEQMWQIVNACVDRNAVDAGVAYGANRNIIYAWIARKDGPESHLGEIFGSGNA